MSIGKIVFSEGLGVVQTPQLFTNILDNVNCLLPGGLAFKFVDDFTFKLSAAVTGNGLVGQRWTAGSASNISINTDIIAPPANCNGALYLNNNGATIPAVQLMAASFRPGTSDFYFSARVRIPIALSNFASTGFAVGLAGSLGAIHAPWFTCGSGSTFWKVCSDASGTLQTTSVTVKTDGTAHVLEAQRISNTLTYAIDGVTLSPTYTYSTDLTQAIPFIGLSGAASAGTGVEYCSIDWIAALWSRPQSG